MVVTAPSSRPFGAGRELRHGPAFHCTGTRGPGIPNTSVYTGGGSTKVRPPGWEWTGDAEQQEAGGSAGQGPLSQVQKTTQVSPGAESGRGVLGAGRSITSRGKRCTKPPAVWGPG